MPDVIDWSDNLHVQQGGVYAPTECKSRQELAIIIPYRNREYHLKLLLKYLHPFLQRQQRFYQIFVVEQVCPSETIYCCRSIENEEWIFDFRSAI